MDTYCFPCKFALEVTRLCIEWTFFGVQVKLAQDVRLCIEWFHSVLLVKLIVLEVTRFCIDGYIFFS